MKSTPIMEMEKYTQIQPLEVRRKEKLMIHKQKLIRLTTHPVNKRIQESTKNRLKRTSFNHLTTQLQQHYKDLLPTSHEEIEPLQIVEEHSHCEKITVLTDVPGIQKKDHLTTLQMKTLTQELIDSKYNPAEWTHVYTDGSAEKAVKNGGGGIYIRYTDGRQTKKAFVTGKISSNYRAETTALLEALRTLKTENQHPPHKIAFFTDCRALLESLKTTKNPQAQIQEITTELKHLTLSTTVALQWIPSHCGIAGSEIADSLSSKAGSKQDQTNHPVNYQEAKTIIRNQCRSEWRKKLGGNNVPDPIHQLQRHQQTILFRLRTGHCGLLSHLH